MRLIDADVFEKNLENEWRLQEISNNDLTQVREWLAQEQTVDAVPVRHGKWNCDDDMFEYAICSACKWDSGEAWEYAKKRFAYCPHCGAKMDAERKADEDSKRENRPL
jgi:hypothetical protein